MLKKGYFYRSGQLTNMTNSDMDELKYIYKIKKIYDLRGGKEISSQPDDVISNIEYENLDILSSATSQTSASIQDMIKNSDNIDKVMLDTYEQLVLSPSAQSNYHYFLIDIIKNEKPFLFHCFAGKDRTGFAAALLLKIAGMTDEVIINDYLLTNVYRKDENKKIIDSMKKDLSVVQLNSLNTALNVEKSYLIHAFKVIQKKYITFDNYLYKGLLLSKKDIETFQKKFLVPV